MNRKGQVLMISLWIIAILVVFALGLAHRASINLRLVRFQRDRLKATCLAKAGINRAILELKNDAQNDAQENQYYDAPNESWADNPEVFQNIVLGENQDEFATISYIDNKEETKYGMTDEESKININTADTALLTQLFIMQDFTKEDAEKLAVIIVNWIDSDSGDEDEQKIFKNEKLKTTGELLLILEYFYEQKEGPEKSRRKAQEVFNRIGSLISVYGNDKLNANTTDEDVLTILANSLAGSNDGERNCIEAVVQEILKQRVEKNYFKEIDDIIVNDDVVSGTSDDKNLFTKLKDRFSVQSNNFRISAFGNVKNVVKKIVAVYDRTNDIIVYWHQN